MEQSIFEQITPYLPFQLQCIIVDDKTDDFQYEEWTDDMNMFKPNAVWELIGINNSKELNIPLGEGYLQGYLYKHVTTYVNFHKGILALLHPLSDLKLNICEDGDIDFELSLYKDGDIRPEDISYKCYEWLIKNHYDYFGLIPKGLAIDINSLKS